MDKDYRYLKQEADKGVFKEGQEVDVVVYAFTDLGVKVAINDTYSGLVYKNEIFDELYSGQVLKAFIKHIREDGKIDVSLQPQEGKHVLGAAEKILKLLNESGGRLPFNDKSSPDDIKNHFQISKKVFKKAVGILYKQRIIKITDNGIEVVL
ncbi:MAG: type I-B CRISPR-associated protein Cas8b1/Cst1 [Candidatus Omnitrophota bacterium]|nr:type I-B CRISPR-associated protein Cas8b1/Cst1 [Candidatus Omnitrophota bacterium]